MIVLVRYIYNIGIPKLDFFKNHMFLLNCFKMLKHEVSRYIGDK